MGPLWVVVGANHDSELKKRIKATMNETINERGQVMGVLVTESTSYAEISPWLGKTTSRKNAVPIWRPGH